MPATPACLPRLAGWLAVQAEMLEVQEPNSGRGGFSTFLRRSPRPRAVPAGVLPGQGRLEPEQCYSPSDLRIGATLTVLGRSLFIYDCDDATRKWYMVSWRRWGDGVPARLPACLAALLPSCLPACPDALTVLYTLHIAATLLRPLPCRTTRGSHRSCWLTST